MKKEQLGGLSPEEKLVEVLESLLSNDPNAFIHVGKSPDNDLTFLFIQTGAMRDTMRTYGRVLLLDHTYKVNKNKMPLTVLMTMDGDLEGRPVGYAFVANEQLVTVKAVMDVFKSAIGDEAASRISSITVDKDYTEIKALAAVFPNAVIQLCDFHVSRTFNGKTHQEDPRVKEILTSMRYCSQEDEFKDLETELRRVATEKFMTYFVKNWLSCPVAWSYRDRKVVANSGNATNNRLENLNGKIKNVVNSSSELYEAVDGIIQIHLNKEEDVVFRKTSAAMKQAYMTKCKDPIANTIVQDLTRNAAKIVIWELDAEPAESEIAKFCSTETNCQCIHACSYKDQLPCRHMFACRRKSGKALYMKEEIDKMFWKESGECRSSSTISGPQIGCHVVPSKLIPKTQSEKYSYSLSLSKQICSSMAECGDVQFMERYNQLKELFKFWCAGTQVKIIDAANFSEIEVHVHENTLNQPEETVMLHTAAPPENEILNQGVPTDRAEAQLQHEESVTLPQNRTVPTTDIIHQDSAGQNTSCIACTQKNFPTGAHKCSRCNKNVHLLPGCSILCPGSEEGHGQKRICIACSKGRNGNQSVTTNRTLPHPSASQKLPSCSPAPSAPHCFCAVPARRIMTSPLCKRPNRPMYKCSLFQCNFTRYAPKQTEDQVLQLDYSASENTNTTIPSSLLDDENDQNLSDLVAAIEASEAEEETGDEVITLSSDDEIEHDEIPQSMDETVIKEETFESEVETEKERLESDVLETGGESESHVGSEIEKRFESNVGKVVGEREQSDVLESVREKESHVGTGIEDELDSNVGEEVGERVQSDILEGVGEEESHVGTGIEDGLDSNVGEEVGERVQSDILEGVGEEESHVGTGIEDGLDSNVGKEVGERVQSDILEGVGEEKSHVGTGIEDGLDSNVGKEVGERVQSDILEGVGEEKSHVGTGIEDGLDSNVGKEVTENLGSNNEKGIQQELRTENRTDVTSASSLLRKSMEGIKLPQVKARGRPRGVDKTVLSVYQKKKTNQVSGKNVPNRQRKPKGAVSGNVSADREASGLAIPDEDIFPDASNYCWNLKSQTSENKLHQVKILQQKTNCSCGLEICVHCLTCSCPDHTHRSIPCKHMHKIVAFIQEKGLKSDSLFYSFQMETVHICFNNENFIYKDKAPPIGPHVTPPTESGNEAEAMRGKARKRPLLFPPTNTDAKLPKPSKGTKTISCVVCNLIAVGNGTLCKICKGVVHVDECSIILNEPSPRICRGCYCQKCKQAKERDHVCTCCVCGESVLDAEAEQCYRCERTVHMEKCEKKIVAPEKGGDTKSICGLCSFSLEKGFTRSTFDILSSDVMLTDQQISIASTLLKNEYGDKIDGLCAPLAVTYGQKVDSINFYPRKQDKDYVQIINTGREHWMTVLFKKGSSSVTIYDSMNSLSLSGHSFFQIAMIAHSKEDRIVIVRPPCKQQTNSTDCGLFAIANAVEYCATGKVTFIDFDTTQMRSHLLQCFENGKISVFPRLSSRPKKSKNEVNTNILHVVCICRLPEAYGNMIECDSCNVWYHNKCVGLSDECNTPDNWICDKCHMKS
ncbi:uncharacterized protein LOC117652699 [Thrips palmi]|uniref:Uncharacterized protein LOC117652699 n=1 Tax=Thrips palmi TaxID=161013 RepID=A0A6P9A6U1_THRPL|nr:uncharacterized protein LOC117652699 [Thrips palmi]